MSETTHTGLTIEVRRDSDVGEYLVGVVIDGAFLPLARPSLGFLEERIALARSTEQTSSPTGPTEPAPPASPMEVPPATP